MWDILTKGRMGETYLIGADGEKNNIDVAARHPGGRWATTPTTSTGSPTAPATTAATPSTHSKLRTRAGLGAEAHRLRAKGSRPPSHWYRRERAAWWQPAKEAVEAKYAKQGQ